MRLRWWSDIGHGPSEGVGFDKQDVCRESFPGFNSLYKSLKVINDVLTLEYDDHDR